MLFETYATLLNLRKVLPSVKSNYVAVEKDYWIALFATKIGEVPVNENWYLEKYPDAPTRYATASSPAPSNITASSAIFEHRMPYPIDVDAAWYASQYNDVHLALTKTCSPPRKSTSKSSASAKERHPYPGFALRKTSDPHPGMPASIVLNYN